MEFKIREELKEIIKKEGDRKEFKYNGYDCLILRQLQQKHLCGYVGLTKNDKYFNIDFNNIDDISCHGGLTFSEFGDNNNRPKKIDDETIWWIGFDCAHYLDIIPAMLSFNPILDEDSIYRDMDYVESECKNIVNQLIRIKNK